MHINRLPAMPPGFQLAGLGFLATGLRVTGLEATGHTLHMESRIDISDMAHHPHSPMPDLTGCQATGRVEVTGVIGFLDTGQEDSLNLIRNCV
jgi:hypothetical protein